MAVILEAQIRDTSTLSKIRGLGLIPAVLYGHKTENVALTVSESVFKKVYQEAGESTIVNLKVNGRDPVPVLIHDVQFHTTLGNILHADFYKVNMAEKLTAKVPLVFLGESSAVKEQGGTLVHQISEIEIESLPADLPHQIDVDISVLKTLNDIVRVSDLKIDKHKVRVLADEDAVVCMVQPPRTEAELAALAETPEEVDVTKVEGVADEKPVEGEEGADVAKDEAVSAQKSEKKE